MQSSKNGILVGVELGLGGGSGTKELSQDNNMSGIIDGKSYFDDNFFNFNGKIFAGYQRYFSQDNKMGYNAKVSFGSGFLSSNAKHQKAEYKDGTTEAGDSLLDMYFSYVPLSFGIEANFLYDFLEKGEQVLGASIGLGYSFVYGININIYNIAQPTESKEVYDKYITNRNIYYSLISPKIALHYYYGKHQVELGFSFDKALGESVNKNNVLYSETSKNESVATTITKPNYFYTFSLSYAYRF